MSEPTNENFKIDHVILMKMNKDKIINNLKSFAMNLAQFYEHDIKVEINVNHDMNIVKFNITEHNL